MLHFTLDISEFIQMDEVGFFLLIMFEDFMINVYIISIQKWPTVHILFF